MLSEKGLPALAAVLLQNEMLYRSRWYLEDLQSCIMIIRAIIELLKSMNTEDEANTVCAPIFSVQSGLLMFDFTAASFSDGP